MTSLAARNSDDKEWPAMSLWFGLRRGRVFRDDRIEP